MTKKILWAAVLGLTLTGCTETQHAITQLFLIYGAIFLGLSLFFGIIVGLICSGIRIIRGFFDI